MLASTSTSKLALVAALLLSPLGATPAWAVGNDRTQQSTEEDFSSSAYTKYGEFNQDSDEDAATYFFQHGRFFGVSLGMGIESALGNRGALWEGGFPAFELQLHYWFDFNFALGMGFYTAKHTFERASSKGGTFDANMLHVGLNLRYYFDTQDSAAAISFANPYLLIGGGSYNKCERGSSTATTEASCDASFGFSLGGGLEFTLKPKRVSLGFEAKAHLVTFSDTNTTDYQSDRQLDDMSGAFYTMIARVLFTW